jgi:DNA-binding NtrC family response regulator
MSKAPLSKSRKVLIADDERSIAETLKMILVKEGLEAIAVYDGRQAIERARDWKPDLYLSDVVMPYVNGIQAGIEIAGMLPDCKVLLLSGQAAVHDLMHEARSRGYNFEILTKPVHPAELLRAVRKILAEQTTSD